MVARRRVGFGAWVEGPYLRTRLGCALALLLLAIFVGSREAEAARYSHADILAAIRMTESGGRERPPDGDGGRAIGPFQIHRRYWMDSGVPGSYEDCRHGPYAERVVRAYMKRWIPEAWYQRDAESIARTHNGGPRGRHKQATLDYWRRVDRWLRTLPRTGD